MHDSGLSSFIYFTVRCPLKGLLIIKDSNRVSIVLSNLKLKLNNDLLFFFFAGTLSYCNFMTGLSISTLNQDYTEYSLSMEYCL